MRSAAVRMHGTRSRHLINAFVGWIVVVLSVVFYVLHMSQLCHLCQVAHLRRALPFMLQLVHHALHIRHDAYVVRFFSFVMPCMFSVNCALCVHCMLCVCVIYLRALSVSILSVLVVFVFFTCF